MSWFVDTISVAWHLSNSISGVWSPWRWGVITPIIPSASTALLFCITLRPKLKFANIAKESFQGINGNIHIVNPSRYQWSHWPYPLLATEFWFGWCSQHVLFFVGPFKRCSIWRVIRVQSVIGKEGMRDFPLGKRKRTESTKSLGRCRSYPWNILNFFILLKGKMKKWLFNLKSESFWSMNAWTYSTLHAWTYSTLQHSTGIQ